MIAWKTFSATPQRAILLCLAGYGRCESVTRSASLPIPRSFRGSERGWLRCHGIPVCCSALATETLRPLASRCSELYRPSAAAHFSICFSACARDSLSPFGPPPVRGKNPWVVRSAPTVHFRSLFRHLSKLCLILDKAPSLLGSSKGRCSKLSSPAQEHSDQECPLTTADAPITHQHHPRGLSSVCWDLFRLTMSWGSWAYRRWTEDDRQTILLATIGRAHAHAVSLGGPSPISQEKRSRRWRQFNMLIYSDPAKSAAHVPSLQRTFTKQPSPHHLVCVEQTYSLFPYICRTVCAMLRLLFNAWWMRFLVRPSLCILFHQHPYSQPTHSHMYEAALGSKADQITCVCKGQIYNKK